MFDTIHIEYVLNKFTFRWGINVFLGKCLFKSCDEMLNAVLIAHNELYVLMVL